jgi:hypothetical protein
MAEQAFGESLDPDKLERLSGCEVHLDRKFERMLAMLLRLKETCGRDDRELIRFAKSKGGELSPTAGIAKSGHSRTAWRTGQIDPERTLEIGAMNGR